MYRVKRDFGGFVVTNGLTPPVKKFSGKGAKSKAQSYADHLNSTHLEDVKADTVGRGNRGRGGVRGA